MHLKLFLTGLIFFMLVGADSDKSRDEEPVVIKKTKIFIAPKKSAKTIYIIPVSENNVWNKIQAENRKLKIQIEKEHDTVQDMVDKLKLASNE